MLSTSPKIAIRDRSQFVLGDSLRYLVVAAAIALCLLLSATPSQAEAPSTIVANQAMASTQPALENRLPTLPESDLSEKRSRVIKGVFYSLALGLLLFSLWKQLKRRGQGVSQHQIEILSRRYVSNNCALVIAQIQGQRFLLSQGADSIQLIAELAEAQAEENSIHSTKAALELPRAIRGERA